MIKRRTPSTETKAREELNVSFTGLLVLKLND
jgi:hypothetical protein